MNLFTILKNKYYIVFIALILIFGIFLRFLTFSSNGYYIVIDECHSLQGIELSTYKNLFFNFYQGANFLPGYRYLLKIIHSLFEYNFLLFKLPSLLLGIFSLFLFYKIIKKIFNNKLVIISALFLFATNYNLIYYSTQIKPYIFDVCIVLIILNSAILIYEHYQKEDIPVLNLIKYMAVSILFCFFSLVSIVIIELYWGILLIVWILNKSKNIFKAIIFQFFISIFIIIEYFSYIIQMHSDNNLKGQWINNGFYFNPSSLDAINSIIHFSHFRFYWFDKDLLLHFPEFIIILYIIIFFIGLILFLIPLFKKNHNIKGLFIVTPFILFITLSFLYIYPFCNRLITFLIPYIIIVELKIFDIKNHKLLKYFALLILSFIIFKYCIYVNNIYQIRENIEGTWKSKNTLAILEQITEENDKKIVISTESICSTCINTKSIIYVDIEKSNINTNKQNLFIYNPQEINSEDNTYMTSLDEIIQNKETIIYIFHSVVEQKNESQIITDAIKNSGYKILKEDISLFAEYKIFNKTTKE